MRLDKYLTQCFIGTRKEVKNIIKQKRIYINNQLVTLESYNVDEKSDIVELDDKVLKYQERYYYILNKPAGYVTSTNDLINPTIMDLFDHLPSMLKGSLFPVGRLDKDTEGLIIVTNDGEFCHKVTSPNYQIEKTYYVEFEGKLKNNAKELLTNNIVLENVTFLPSKLEKISDNSCYLTITEGKYHQVKRMIHYLGAEVTYLKRVQIGKLILPSDLDRGRYIEIDENKLKSTIL